MTETAAQPVAAEVDAWLERFDSALTEGDTAAAAELFTEDCYVAYGPNFGAEGRAAYRETLSGIGSFFAATSHHVSNVVVDFGPDLATATVRSVLYAWHKYTRDRPDGHFFGQYHDELVKVDGHWRFARRELRASGVVDFHVKQQIPIGRA